MKKRIKKFIALIAALSCVFITCAVGVNAENAANYPNLELDCKSAVLMEASTGKILYAKNENEALPPASVTKVMTLLLVMEAIKDGKLNYTDMLTASEHACSMGGSQIFLEVGERMSVEDLLKSVIIASANDAAVVLAEAVAGTEGTFVDMMNARARELGMENTVFENTNGLDDTTENHLASAKDIAIMSRELIKYPKITEYSKIWMDTVRNGEFGLTNTNRLIRFYEGATGLKTGSTSKAGFCITATAVRGGMTLIAVIMGASGRDARNSSAVALLNYGFSNFTVFKSQPGEYKISVEGGRSSFCNATEEEFVAVINKKHSEKIEKSVECADVLKAPIEKGSQIGTVTYNVNGESIGTVRILTDEAVDTIRFSDILIRLLAKICMR